MSAADSEGLEGNSPSLSFNAPLVIPQEGPDTQTPEPKAQQSKDNPLIALNSTEAGDEDRQPIVEQKSEKLEKVITESEKLPPDVSIKQRQSTTINTRQQWGTVHFREKFKPRDTAQKYHDVHSFLFESS